MRKQIGLGLVMGLVFALCGCAKPTNRVIDEAGYAMERLNVNGLTLTYCSDQALRSGRETQFEHSCSYTAPDGTEWYVSKRWKR